MAQAAWTIRARRAHRELLLLKALAGAVLGVLGAGWSTGAVGPSYGTVAGFEQSAPRAALLRSGDDVIITGSIGHLFDSGFSGPNRAEKRDRLRPAVDVLEVASAFDSIRARIASLRLPKELVETAVPTVEMEVAVVDPEPIDVVASLQPEVTSSALSAIDEAALGGAPLPSSQSQQLAYARAELPETVFDGTVRDKSGRKVSDKEFKCMAEAIYFEARGESYRGQIAVGQVVMNRVAHKLYPDTICSVVYQNAHKRNACQFSFACDGWPERITEQEAWKTAEEVARGVIAGDLYLPEVGYATHYHATYVKPHWAKRMTKVTKVGSHVFYKFKRGWKYA